jgi:hypothetical protein
MVSCLIYFINLNNFIIISHYLKQNNDHCSIKINHYNSYIFFLLSHHHNISINLFLIFFCIYPRKILFDFNGIYLNFQFYPNILLILINVYIYYQINYYYPMLIYRIVHYIFSPYYIIVKYVFFLLDHNNIN